MSPEMNDPSQPVWYFVKEGSRFGPFSFYQIQQLSASGRLLPDDLIWRPGFEQWARAREISGLFNPYPTPAPSFQPVANYPAGGAPVKVTAPAPSVGATLIWLIVLLFACLGTLAYSFLFSKNTTNLAFLIILTFPIGLLTWGVFYAVIGRKHGLGKAALSLFAIYGSLIAGGIIGYSQQRKAARRMVSEIQKEFSTLAESATDPDGRPRPIERRADTAPAAKGEFGEMERFVKNFLNQMASQRNEYSLELNAIGWEKILDPERLKEDRTLAESKLMTNKARVIVNKYRDKTYAIIDDIPHEISSLNISEITKKEMLSGFNKGMEKSRRHIDVIWDLEGKVISEFENIFALLSRKGKVWTISNGQILFYKNNDLNRFNAYVSSIQDMVRQQQVIQKQSIETSNEFFNKFKQ
jgi:phage FluMu protein gp41